MSRQLPPGIEPFPGPQCEAVTEPGRCAWKGCAEKGAFPAPKDRLLAERYFFCLDHVRAYNAQWDYHRGLSAAEMEAELRSPATWGRPTWKLGSLGPSRRFTHENLRVDDPLNLGADTAFDTKQRAWRENQGHGRPSGVGKEQAKALKLMGLTLPLTVEILRRRYKALVKKHHPDANGGSPEAETLMKRINAAYQTLHGILTGA